MKVEIERKFLLASDGWRKLVEFTHHIRDGLIAVNDECKTRVRIIGDRATLSVKTKRVAGSRLEFEYDVPRVDAELMLEHCDANTISKYRHYVPYGGMVWEIDEYDDVLRGVVLAEVELTSINQVLDIPSWIGHEVTAEPAYRKFNMLNARRQAMMQNRPA